MRKLQLVTAQVPASASHTSQGWGSSRCWQCPLHLYRQLQREGAQEHRRCAFPAWLCYAFRAFSLRQAAAACSLSAPCPAQHSWSNPVDAGSTVFLDVTSTPSRNRNSMLKEFLCLISRFQVLFCTMLCSETVGTSCSPWACHLCLVSLPACPPFQLLLRVKDMWLGGWQQTRWCAGEHCCGQVTCQRPHYSRMVAESALSHRCRTISAVWDCTLPAFPWSKLF